MSRKCSVLFILPIAICFSQDVFQPPSFPDVFQTEIEGIFKEEDRVVEMDASMFYDRVHNRAALFMLKENKWTRKAYDFENDESIVIEGNYCDVQPIPDKQGFFPFTVDQGKKKLSSAAEAFFFTKSELVKQSSTDAGIPTLIYHATIDIPQYGKKNCEVTHVFTKPDFELAICKEGWYCNSTLLTLSVQCKNDQGATDVDHVYRFSRFKYNIEDESVFLPPPGIHCEITVNFEPMPLFSSYFSFTYDIIENPIGNESVSSNFKMHKEVWYDEDYKILRLDEFEIDELQFSSRVFDVAAGVEFKMVGGNRTCDTGLVLSDFQIAATTRLPQVFFSKRAIFVGKRKVHGLDYLVWSLMWLDSQSQEKHVEEAYFPQIDPNNTTSASKKMFNTQISHVDTYTYDESYDEDSEQYKLIRKKHYSINNYRIRPKEWSAFDVSSCFQKNQKKEFSIKIEKFPLVKGSQSYKDILQKFYEKIIQAAESISTYRVSVLRISELRGIFDGMMLLEIRGSILNNSKSSGWPRDNPQPGMEKIFGAIKKAASEGKLSVTFWDENETKHEIKVISIQDLSGSPPDGFRPPSFPDVFQTDIKATFRGGKKMVEMSASMYYDRVKNRAALFTLKENKLTRQAYDFDNGESITISGNICTVQQISDEQGFFPFTLDKGKKKLSSAKEMFFFTKSELDSQSFAGDGVPVLIYHTTTDILQYGKTNCEVTHVFTKPDFKSANCKKGLYCNSTLLTLSVQCKNDKGVTDVDRVYKFSPFKYNIEDESVFLPPPGIHCEMKNKKPMPPFPSYFSFTFETVGNPTRYGEVKPNFKQNKEVRYDEDYKIIRIDEFENDGLLFKSSIFDLNESASFTIYRNNRTCDRGAVPSDFSYHVNINTRLPKVFLDKNLTATAVFVGKRTLEDIDYQVWSMMWSFPNAAARMVEEVYFLELEENKDASKDTKVSYTQLSHVDARTYEWANDKEYELLMRKHISISNYRTMPKEWSAFDVSSCIRGNGKKKFAIKIEQFPLVKESQSYKEILQQFHEKIIEATGVSVMRISELRGIFDGMLLLEIRGTILDNSKSSGWPTNSKEPGMEKVFDAIKKAATEGNLSVTFKGENDKAQEIKVISVEALDDSPPTPPPVAKSGCFSGGSMAGASVGLFLLGVGFGVIGYYVFLKKGRLSNTALGMNELHS